MLRTAVLGASGYAGGELLRLIAGHPRLELTHAIANSLVGEQIAKVFPNLTLNQKVFTAVADVDFDQVDAVFLALPHGESSKLLTELPNHLLIVDLGADYRLKSHTAWRSFYPGDHAGNLTYGLADIPNHYEKISGQKRIANPGCYATAINLSLAPFMQNADFATETINVVATSGTSGAGRKASTNLITAENMNNMSAYKVAGKHQHTPEIEQFLTSMSNRETKISFTPILAPMPRGILAVSHVQLAKAVSNQELQDQFVAFYEGNSFIKLLEDEEQPQTKAVTGTNNAHFQVSVDQRTNQVVITAAIDNLIKGAAGQAIQNLNLMAGFDYDIGLKAVGVFP